MKKITTYFIAISALLFFAAQGVQAQHFVGARAGYGSGTSSFYPPQDMGSVWGLYSGGVSWKYYSPEKYLGGIEIDALFMQQGFKRFSKTLMDSYFPGQGDTTGYEKRTINSIMVPIFWQPHLYMFNKQARIFLNLGVTFSYNISSRQEFGSKINGTVEANDYEMRTVRDNRWGYGLCGGGGFGWQTGRVEIFGECRYYLGYSDVLKNRSKYPYNPIRSPLNGLQISFGAFIQIGKPGILSDPGARRGERLKKRDAERLEESAPPVE